MSQRRTYSFFPSGDVTYSGPAGWAALPLGVADEPLTGGNELDPLAAPPPTEAAEEPLAGPPLLAPDPLLPWPPEEEPLFGGECATPSGKCTRIWG